MLNDDRLPPSTSEADKELNNEMIAQGHMHVARTLFGPDGRLPGEAPCRPPQVAASTQQVMGQSPRALLASTSAALAADAPLAHPRPALPSISPRLLAIFNQLALVLPTITDEEILQCGPLFPELVSEISRVADAFNNVAGSDQGKC